MKNKEAITTLESESCYECSWGCESPVKCNCPKCDLKSAVNMAIDALQENESLARSVNEASELLRKKRPRGEWRDFSDMGFVECPFCEHATNCDDNIEELHYCFFCGAELRKGGET